MALPDLVSFVVDTCKVSKAEAQQAIDVARADLQPAMDAVVLALAYGNVKHSAHSWYHHVDVDWRLTEKALRHLVRYHMSPTAADVESNLHHLIHLLANVVLLYEAARMRGYVVFRAEVANATQNE